jgi:RimJ/RimL family protein N-acetyltransferase
VTLRFPAGMEPLVLSFPEQLELDGVRVRLPTLDDVDAVAPAFVDPDVGGEAGMPPFEAEDLRAFVTHAMPQFMASGRLAPYLIEADGEVLGGISLHHFDDGRRSIEIGYWLFAHARGRGLASRAVGGLVDWAFANGVRRVEAVVRLENEASNRVLERLGFRREGVKRRLLRYRGGWADATLFARLADDDAVPEP